MARVSVGTYSIRVRRLRTDDWLPLDAFHEGSRLLEVIARFLDDLGAPNHDEEHQRVLRSSNVARDERSLWGTVELGDYGYAADLMDIETMRHTYDRNAQEAELVPLFFLLDCPANTTQGIAVLQRLGRLGMKTALEGYLKRRFSDAFPGFGLYVNPHVPDEVLDYLENGSLKEIELLSYAVPNDIADTVRLGQYREDEVHVRTTVKANRGRELPLPNWIRRVLRGEMRLHEVISPEYETARITVRFGGVQRSVDLARPGRIAPYLSCEDDVEMRADGHPETGSMLAFARELVTSLRDRMGQ